MHSLCSSVRRLRASSPSACNVIAWLYMLEFLIYITLELRHLYNHYRLLAISVYPF